MKRAEFYQKRDENNVQCLLCPHNCLISEGKKGRCRSRINLDGELYAENYGKTVTVNPYDPVEKKPLFHFLPGSRVLSIGADFCNLSCSFCQNYSISQEKCPTQDITLEKLTSIMQEFELKTIAYTYTEPIIWYEFMYDSAKYLKSLGFKTIMVSNGFINQKPLEALLPYIDAFNIDLKSIRDDFYQKICGGRLLPVQETIKTIYGKSHLEVTNLLITGENDSDQDILDLITFIADIDPRVPLHFSRYFPCYKLQNPATSAERLEFAYKEASKRLKHVYIGNMAFENNLICENCAHIISERSYGKKVKLKEGQCPQCGHRNYGIWQF
ncbi:MAG: AmmeMemoRadiSam system radical SAM enzyme [Candidatus Cloacimonetes bacterium]|nr:AmmeMemoRadiSam system radical SAM enzyme [Candidatus Cloacimonadota bacterium]